MSFWRVQVKATVDPSRTTLQIRENWK